MHHQGEHGHPAGALAARAADESAAIAAEIRQVRLAIAGPPSVPESVALRHRLRFLARRCRRQAETVAELLRAVEDDGPDPGGGRDVQDRAPAAADAWPPGQDDWAMPCPASRAARGARLTRTSNGRDR